MALPIMGFSEVVQLHLAGEDTHIIHQRPGYTSADAVIHFEGNGILYSGPAFTSDGFPRIDTARGGKMSSMIETVDYFVTAFAQRPAAIEPVIPGRGPIATIADLRDYRDMLRAVHDRVQAIVKSGRRCRTSSPRSRPRSSTQSGDTDQSPPSSSSRWSSNPSASHERCSKVSRSSASRILRLFLL